MIDMIMQCAPEVHHMTMSAIIKQESGGNPYALNDNTNKKSYKPKTFNEALQIAKRLIATGASVDIGLAQINSKNLPGLRLSVEDVLDPCKNIMASQTILKEGWARSGGDLKRTLSAYNTGKTNSKIGAAYAERVLSKIGGQEVKIQVPKQKGVTNDVIYATAVQTSEPVVVNVEYPVEYSSLTPSQNGLSPAKF